MPMIRIGESEEGRSEAISEDAGCGEWVVIYAQDNRRGVENVIFPAETAEYA